MRLTALLLWALVSTTSALAQVSISISLPGVTIGINVPTYPQLVQVPGYPVYYAPRLRSNYFFYDGMYWVYQDDDWYASSWYNGPWGRVDAVAVPLFVLRIPVRYYRNPPVYFRGWRSDAPPRWGDHWGRDWEQRRDGWDRWNRRSVPAPAPLPYYQRQYSGNRYPDVAQQPLILGRQYRYQPRDEVVQRHYEEQAVQRAPVPPTQRSPRQTDDRRPVQREPQPVIRPQPQPQPQPQVQPPTRAPVPPRSPQQQVPLTPAPAPAPMPPRADPQRQVQPVPNQPGRAVPGSPQRSIPADKVEQRPARSDKPEKPDKPEKAERGRERDKSDERGEPPPVRR